MAKLPFVPQTTKFSKRLTAPHDAYVILTHRCQLHCLHCYASCGNHERENRELNAAEWGTVFEQLGKLGVFFLNIAGGEPTMHPEFPEIIQRLISLNMHYILTTNGMGTQDCAEAIARSKDLLIGLKVSLDGPTAESHGFLRVDHRLQPNLNAFHQTMKTIMYLKERDVSFTIATCLHKGNIHLMDQFLNLILEIRPTTWSISTIAATGRARDYFDHIFISDNEHNLAFWNRIETTCKSAGIYVRYVDMSTAEGLEGIPTVISCPAATNFCEINSDGTVAPCPIARVEIPQSVLKFDNVRQKSIEEIWNGTVFEKFREWKMAGCDGCVASDACGRCVAQSIQWFKEPGKPTPYCIGKGEILNLDNLLELRQHIAEELRNLSHA